MNIDNSNENVSLEEPSFFGLSRHFCIVLVSSSLVFLFILIIGISTYNKETVVIEDNKSGGSIKLNFDTDYNIFTLAGAYPVSDAVGTKSKNYYDFSVETDLKQASRIEYDVVISNDEDNTTLPENLIKVYLEKEEDGSYVRLFGPSLLTNLRETTLKSTKEEAKVITSVRKIKSGVDNYRLRIWLAETSSIPKGDYSIKINIKGVAK